mmetsp:Transcript_11681/g.25052  ORF Transcript_11681/g.25052 Transcript_11681/m.25052 type:complete len:91 (-) Transcript_11681:1494-1766(-)
MCIYEHYTDTKSLQDFPQPPGMWHSASKPSTFNTSISLHLCYQQTVCIKYHADGVSAKGFECFDRACHPLTRSGHEYMRNLRSRSLQGNV